MNMLLVWKEQLKIIYAKYSFYIMIGFKLVLGLLVFGLINSNVGFMEPASSGIVTVGLAAVSSFLPVTVMVIAATLLLLLHFYKLSVAIMIVTALYFLLMYIFYFRFPTGKAWLILLTAVAFSLKVPIVAAVAVGLLGTPVCLVPVACGTFSYYIIQIVKNSTSSFKAGEGIEGLVQALTAYMKQSLYNKEMWVMVIMMVVCVLVVYGIRTRSVDHAWKIAAAAGSVAAILTGVMGNVVLDLHISYFTLVAGGVLAVLVGLLLEASFLSVDYARTELLEFEDDEYHYYVKAVPKFAVTAPKKNVTHILERQENKTSAARDSAREGRERRQQRGQSQSEEKYMTRSLDKELGVSAQRKNKPQE